MRLATTEDELRFHHYAAVVDAPEFEWLGAVQPPFDEHSLAGVDALIVSCEHHYPSRLAIAACGRLGVPTFHVLDGIIEWRNLFENPRSMDRSQGAPLFQPLISDYTFAMGRIQQQTLQWLGNSSVLPTGLPRLDCLDPQPCREGSPPKPARLMVCTANSPWFTLEQREVCLREFGRLAEGLMGLQEESDLDCEVVWRVADSVAEALGLASQVEGAAVEALESCHALITMPSSIAVEAMLLGVPTLIFDPFARPILSPSAWSSTSVETVLRLLPSLLAPNAHRSSLQDFLLAGITASDRGATQRIRDIISRVVVDGYSPDHESLDSGFTSRVGALEPQEAKYKGLADTIPLLDRRIVEKNRVIEALHRERARPTVRHALGCLYRSIARLWTR